MKFIGMLELVDPAYGHVQELVAEAEHALEADRLELLPLDELVEVFGALVILDVGRHTELNIVLHNVDVLKALLAEDFLAAVVVDGGAGVVHHEEIQTEDALETLDVGFGAHVEFADMLVFGLVVALFAEFAKVVK